jgi:hypothetical protein
MLFFCGEVAVVVGDSRIYIYYFLQRRLKNCLRGIEPALTYVWKMWVIETLLDVQF